MTIQIKQRVWDNLINYARAAEQIHSSEIAGWAHYTHSKGIYKLAPLCKQEVKAAEVDNFPDEILHRVDYDMSDMIVQWHSHVNKGVTPSGVDTKNIADAMELFDSLISIIVNVRGDYSCRIDYKTVNFFGVTTINTIDKIQLQIGTNEVPLKIWEEVITKCYKPKPVVVSNNPYADNYKGWGYEHHQTVKELFPESSSDPVVTVKQLFPPRDENIIPVETDGNNFHDLFGYELKFSSEDLKELRGLMKEIVKLNTGKIAVVEDDVISNYLCIQLFDGKIALLDENGIEFSNFIFDNLYDFQESLKTVYGKTLTYVDIVDEVVN